MMYIWRGCCSLTWRIGFALRPGHGVVAFAPPARQSRVSAASAAFGSVRLGSRTTGDRGGKCVKLQNEANFLECCRLWISLRDSKLES
jgi:hypothetical protein